MQYLGEAIEAYTIHGLISMKWDEITESPDSLERAAGRIAPDINLAVTAKNMKMEAKADTGKKVYEGKTNSVDDIISGLESGTLRNVDARKWHLGQEVKIPDLIDNSLPLEQQTRQAFDLGNQYGTQAGELISDRQLAESLHADDSNLTWE